MICKLRFGIILSIISAIAITPSLSLKCFQCRTNVCNHKFCTEANSLMETSETTMSAEAWKKLPLCPSADARNTTKDENQAEYTATCPKKAVGCGRTIFNITTTSTKNILPGSAGNQSSIVPVLGSGRESENSSVTVYGCVLPKFKACPHGYTLKYKVPGDSQDQPSSDAALTEVIATNTDAACCHCRNDLCNEIQGNLDCSPQAPESVSDPGIGGTGTTGGSDILRPLSAAISLLVAAILVLASF